MFTSRTTRRLVQVTAALTLAATPLLGMAESNYQTGVATAAAGAVARLDFSIIIPKVLFLGVGTGSAGTAVANNTAIDLVTFDYTTNPGAVGLGTAAGTITGNVVPVRVLGNNGAISLVASTAGALTDGGTNTIPWSEITAVSSDAANLPSPAIPVTGNGAATNVVVSSGKVTNRTANWTYSYANTTVVAAGTYGGAGTTAAAKNSGRVTYTATMP